MLSYITQVQTSHQSYSPRLFVRIIIPSSASVPGLIAYQNIVFLKNNVWAITTKAIAIMYGTKDKYTDGGSDHKGNFYIFDYCFAYI